MRCWSGVPVSVVTLAVGGSLVVCPVLRLSNGHPRAASAGTGHRPPIPGAGKRCGGTDTSQSDTGHVASRPPGSALLRCSAGPRKVDIERGSPFSPATGYRTCGGGRLNLSATGWAPAARGAGRAAICLASIIAVWVTTVRLVLPGLGRPRGRWRSRRPGPGARCRWRSIGCRCI